MKWMGLTLIVVGILMVLDHRNGFVPIAVGVFMLGYWYFVEREPEPATLDESDYLHRDEHGTQLQESSTSFDLPDFAPFLQGLSNQIAGGYNEKVIGHLADLAVRMKLGEERSMEYEVVFRGERVPLRIGLFKDDVEEITIYFHAPKLLAAYMDAEMARFFAGRGM